MSDDNVARLMRLFAGFEGAYGTHGATKKNENKGGKLEIKQTAETRRGAVTRELWAAHVAGEAPLGIIPIREDGTCYWGVVDVDAYDLDLAEVVARVAAAKLPLVCCRSKSGGAHLFLFLKEPAPAADLQKKLRELAAALGWGGSEIFPKQTQMLLERGDLGNWLNMPYFGGDETERYGVKAKGGAMTLAEFLRAAEAARVSPETLATLGAKRRRPPVEGEEGDLGGGPPCLQHLVANGFPEHTTNNGVFALGVLARKKYPERWREVLEDWNRRLVDRPRGTEEMREIIKSLDRKEYQYRCKDVPLCNHCNSALCRTRKFGVGGGDEDYPVVSGLSVLDSDPPLWFLDVGEARIEMSTDELQSYKAFHKLCMEKLFVCFKMLKQDTWLTMVAQAMRDAVRIEAPREVGTAGRFYELLEDFCVNRHRGEVREDLLLGRPWEDQEAGRHYFRLRDLESFLEKANFKAYRRSQLVARIRGLGGEKHFFNIKDHGVNVWWVPSNFVPTPTTELPPIEEDSV